MASRFSTSPKTIILFLFFLFTSLHHFTVSAFEYEVGNTNGWTIPPSNNTMLYNKWASQNRFKIGDTLHFKYQKDSVLLVKTEEYIECNSTHPIYFSNNGDSEFTFDRSGMYYFISGVSGHCELGQKMVVRVLTEDAPPGESGSTATRVSGFIVLQVVLFSAWSLLY